MPFVVEENDLMIVYFLNNTLMRFLEDLLPLDKQETCRMWTAV